MKLNRRSLFTFTRPGGRRDVGAQVLRPSCRPESDAVHRQSVAGGGGEGAAGGARALHGRELSPRVHAEEHAGAAGTPPHAASWFQGRQMLPPGFSDAKCYL